MIQISADRQRARCVRSANERITTGLTGKAVTFRFGAGWENVTARTAVFEGSGVTRDCLIENGEATIPHECLTVPGGVLRCGVYGVEGDKKTPTVYAELGQIERGADPSGDTSTDPTLAVWAQILAKMGSLDDLTTEAKNTLVAAINEAAQTGGGGGTVTEAEIEKALGYKPIGADDVPVKKVNGATGEVKGTFYVTVTQGNGNNATADKTAEEVYAAYAAGYAVYAIAKFRDVEIPYALPLGIALSTSGTVVLGFGSTGSSDPTGKPKYFNVAYDGLVWLAWGGMLAKNDDVPTELKNPYSLRIKIGNATTVYDGSAAKTVEIPEGGGTDESLGITSAAVGDIVKVKAVDANGKPTAWEAADKNALKEDVISALGYTPANAPDVLLCTISGAGTSASPFTCDKTTAQIYEAAQAGKQVYVVTDGIFLPLSFVSEHAARFTKMTSTDTTDGMQGSAALVTVRSDGKVSAKQTGLEQTSNKVNTISASSTVAEYPSAKAVWNAIPHPEAKTDAMTQAVGKDADGKLWTAPGGGSGGGGFAPTLVASLVADGTTSSIMQNIDIAYPAIYTVSIHAKAIADTDNAGQTIFALFGGKTQFEAGVSVRSIKTVNNTFLTQLVALTFALDAEKKIRTIGKAENNADSLTNWGNYEEGSTLTSNAVLLYSSTNKIIPAGYKCDVWRWM